MQINEELEKRLRDELVTKGARTSVLFGYHFRIVPPGSCLRGCEATVLPDGCAPSFCSQCGNALVAGQGIVARGKGIASARQIGAVVRLCACGCDRRVQKTNRGLIVRDESGYFYFRRVAEPCAHAALAVRKELITNGGKPGVVKNLKIFTAKEAKEKLDLLTGRVAKTETKPEAAGQPAQTNEEPIMANDDTDGTDDTKKTDPNLLAVDADLLALEGQLRDADFDRTRVVLRAWLERKDANFPSGGNEACGIDHEYHSGDASKTKFLIVGDDIVAICGRAVAGFHKARQGLERTPKLWATRGEAEKVVAERRQRREAQDVEKMSIVRQIQAAWDGKGPLPLTREKCGFDHASCGESRGGIVVIENDVARVVELCGLACGAYKASEIKWSPIFRTHDEANARATQWNERQQATQQDPEERVKRLREFVVRVGPKVEAGCAASEEARRYEQAKDFLARIDASRQQAQKSGGQPTAAVQPGEPPKRREQRRRNREQVARATRDGGAEEREDEEGMRALERGMRRNGGDQPAPSTGKQVVTIGDACPALAALREQLPPGADPGMAETLAAAGEAPAVELPAEGR